MRLDAGRENQEATKRRMVEVRREAKHLAEYRTLVGNRLAGLLERLILLNGGEERVETVQSVEVSCELVF